MVASETAAPASSDTSNKAEWSVLRTAELFALTKRSAAALEYEPRFVYLVVLLHIVVAMRSADVVLFHARSKKVRITTKLEDTYLNLPESLLEAKPTVLAGSDGQDVEEEEKDAETSEGPTRSQPSDIVLGGNEYPSAPGTDRFQYCLGLVIDTEVVCLCIGVATTGKASSLSLVDRVAAEAEENRATKKKLYAIRIHCGIYRPGMLE